jgi:hypothetical protein
MGFLSSLGGIINDQFGIGENTSHSLDVIDGRTESFGKLGDFAKKIDQSAERYYIEDGFIRDIRPRSRSILFQQPDIYVVIKKRMFSTLQENTRLDLLEEKERILVAATKRLFQNKVRILAAYEKLTKIEQLTYESGRFNTFLAPALFDLLDSSSDLFNIFNISGSTKSAIDKLRRVISYSEPGQYSNWSTNGYDAVFGKDIGEGPGTFELTNVASLTTTVSTDWEGGSANLTLEDPYNLLTVTEKDIDQALTDVTNPMRTGSTFMLADKELQKQIEDLKAELSVERRSRQASQITFKVSSGTILSKRVRAILDDEGVEIAFTYSTGVQDTLSSIGKASNIWDVASSIGNAFSTGSVQIEPQFIAGNDSLGMGENNQLTSSERQKFTAIISDIFTLLGQRETSRRELKARSISINYARNRMRLFFNGKFIIQPMDTITIWMTSRTGEDQRLPGGFSKQVNDPSLSIARKFDTVVKNINNQLQSLRDPTGEFAKTGQANDWDDVERLSIVGPDMPKWLWRQFRQDITSQPTGPCIFSGIVGKGNQGVTGSWSDGKWTIQVTCEDNTGFFNKSQVNFKPAADVFNSTIYDPLTPFDVSFDAATGVPITSISAGDLPPLLPENQKLLRSGVTTFRSGAYRGSTASEDKWRVPSKEISFDSFRAVMHDPEGMVYRWKQGIQSLTKISRPNAQVDVDEERAVLITKEPLAGQDVMNVISLLITGQPYNYDTFLKAAIANGNSMGKKDEITNLSAAQTYIGGLLANIERVNLTWGNFIPHKKLTVNQNAEKFIAEQRMDIITQNEKLKQKLRERAQAEDDLILQMGGSYLDPAGAIGRNSQGQVAPRPDGSTGGPDPLGGVGTALKTRIDRLSNEIRALQNEFDETINNVQANNQNIGLTLIGNDIISNPTLNDLDDTKSTPAQRDQNELQLREKLFQCTARRFWQVRANNDQNYFIVDDQYDKNFDIMAFERKIGGKIELFNSEYTNIGDKITTVRQLLGLECFANTQGHIEVRPPLYNRMPSSVFYKMFRDRDETGVKVFPDFLESLFFNQIKGIFNRIEIIEDQIRLRATALGATDDNGIIGLIQSGSSGGASSSFTFSFLTSSTGDGKIGTQSLQNMLPNTMPDFIEGLGSGKLEPLESNISIQSRAVNLFSTSIQANAIANFNPNVEPNRQATQVDEIRKRLRIKTGQEPPTLNELFGNPQFERRGQGTTVSQLDRINIISQISSFVSERQTLMKSALNAIRNLKEGVAINAPDGQNGSIFSGGLGNLSDDSKSNKTSSVLTTPFLNRKTEIPLFLQHMIEYEDEDDIGPGSGRRFVLSPDRIISLTISENPPPYNTVTINGLFSQGLSEPPSQFNTSDGGNQISTAWAVDYDMWYQYGFRVSRAIDAPFLSDPDSQCAPFAISVLLAARESIFQGSVQVAGYNEYYQPGDVVYIEDRNLLFYVYSVKHSFSYGKLDTTLELTYGHNPGEYIPTMLDMAGKILYNSQGFTGQFRSERQQMQGSARSLGALSFVSTWYPQDDGSSSRVPFPSKGLDISSSTVLLDRLLQGPSGKRNTDILTNALFATSGSLNQVGFKKQKTRIKIVYYIASDSHGSEMFTLAKSVRNWFTNPEQTMPSGLNPSDSLSPNKMDTGGAKPKSFGLNDEDVIIEAVDMTDPQNQTRAIVFPQQLATDPSKNNQGPSSAAIQVTREAEQSDVSDDYFRTLLADTVLDIFADYTIVRKPSTSQTNGSSESGQADNASIDVARNAPRPPAATSVDDNGDPLTASGDFKPL